MLYVLVFAAFVYIIFNITKFNTSLDPVDVLIKETHVYSGIHEESYGSFYTNMQLAKEHKSDVFLEKALHHLNEIPLYMSPMDPEVQADIAVLGHKIAVAFERIMMKDAMNNKTYYRPKYI